MNNETFSRDDIVIVNVNPMKTKEITPETIAAAMTKMNLANNQKKNQEKASPPIEKYRRLNKLSVTDMSELSWCEQKFHYSLIYGKVRTNVMKIGTTIHSKLELEDHKLIEVKRICVEDDWGVKLTNLLIALTSLTKTKKSREIPIFGFLFDSFIIGVIDEIKHVSRLGDNIMNNDMFSKETFEQDKWIISDTKTKSRIIKPSKSTILMSTKVQLMLYKKLFDELIKNQMDFKKMFEHLNLNPDRPFSSDLQELLSSFDFKQYFEKFKERKLEYSLSLLAELINEYVKSIGTSSNLLEVNYRYQGDGKDLGSVLFEFEEENLEKKLKRGILYWKGIVKPQGVEIEEAWKCRQVYNWHI
ncbi:22976_t:CDS:2 [Entrophospora sp. SA101]|nr:532_t:CDS:2 [Entrophospora sp. SA101]CAJ0756561.1 22976_t:CDS:2 [Entrophospora sp. SA101]CAJ0915288.1 2214_t:CDS:2 [Entrophospora sp. SA101]